MSEAESVDIDEAQAAISRYLNGDVHALDHVPIIKQLMGAIAANAWEAEMVGPANKPVCVAEEEAVRG